MTSVDLLIAGAGPGGCATALAFAAQGRQAVLVGPRGSPDRGLAGEWLHPAGVWALQHLGVGLRGNVLTENHGFVLHPGPDCAPVTLPYPDNGTAVSMKHQVLVDRLREAAAQHRGVTLLLGEHVTKAAPDGHAVTTAGVFRAGLLVGADGRASLVRRALRPGEPPAATLSATAGFELTGARLPIEGYGHIFLGGPGPALAYRIGPDSIRLSLDVTTGRMPPPEMLRHLRRCYAPALPEELRAAFLDSSGHPQHLRWAANRFRHRLFYGSGRVALVGDAVGFGHPIAAHGMTTAVLDAECLPRHGDLAGYARERHTRSWASERLSMALHRALTDTTAASVVLREALFHLWRHNMIERDRMMRLLAVHEDRRGQFNLAVAHVAANALARTGQDGPRLQPGNALTRRIRTTCDLATWLRWLYTNSTRNIPEVLPGPT